VRQDVSGVSRGERQELKCRDQTSSPKFSKVSALLHLLSKVSIGVLLRMCASVREVVSGALRRPCIRRQCLGAGWCS